MSDKQTLRQTLPTRIHNMLKVQEARKAEKKERLELQRLIHPK